MLTATKLFVLLLCYSLIGLAQESVPEPDLEAATESSAASNSEATDSTVAKPDSNRDPGNYRSSEQISEDLSVSYPVDI